MFIRDSQCTAHTILSGRLHILTQGNAGSNGSWTAAAGTATVIDTYIVGSYSNAEYTLYFNKGTDHQCQKFLVMDNGSDAFGTEYAVMYNVNHLVDITCDVSGGNVRVLATPKSGINGSTTYKFTRSIMV